MSASAILVAFMLVLGGGRGPTSQPADELPAAGIWPTEKMVESMVRRTALEAAEAYDLTDEQYRQVESQLLDRWPRFLSENRKEIQPLLNEYLEARMAFEPPTEEQMKAWAEKALPVAERFEKQIEAGNKEIQKLLTPLQRVKFETETLKVKAGLELFRQRLQSWQRGDFEPREVWDPPEPAGAGGPWEAQNAESPGGRRRPPGPVEQELDAWDRYVAKFIETHGLNEGQRRTTFSILREVKQRARAHRDLYAQDIYELERMIRAGRPVDEAKVRSEAERLYGPIDELFAELQARLSAVPTEAQRRAATQPASDKPKNEE